MKTVAFDVYGTLIDTAGVVKALDSMVYDKAVPFSNLWRTKQLEYSWRYGLMGVYRNFRQCTEQALEHCCEVLECNLSSIQKSKLMQQYLELPAFDDIHGEIEKLHSSNIKLYAFSNGVREDVDQLLNNAGIHALLDGVVSVDEFRTFKPSPTVYQQFLVKTDCLADNCWLVSSNPFDVCGAVSSGWHAIWLQRNRGIKFDPWEFQPDYVVENFSEVVSRLRT